MEIIYRDGRTGELTDYEQRLEVLRHSTSHLMALAVADLFPEVHLGIGPPTSEGFFYDFERAEPFAAGDLARIEEKMAEYARQNLEYRPSLTPIDEAVEMFSKMGEGLKVELIQERADQTLSIYRLGKFVDFCMGPHLRNTSQIGPFKLLSVAGAYWKGDEKREQMQRIYGTAFFTQQELDAYLQRLEESRRRDHRKLGRELDLFSVQDHAAPGLIFWHPKGARVRAIIEDFLRREHERRGYQYVVIPHIAKGDLWRTSGHYDYYRQNMYTFQVEDEEYVLKPMNCPGHILIYKSTMHSYRDLPIRYAEFGTVYRYERSGTLHGMLRVRGFTQDDAHIFCTPEQVYRQVVEVMDLAEFVLKTFGFEKYRVDLSVRDPRRPQDYAGTAEEWEFAESNLMRALSERQWEYHRIEGEAVFYGPKIDIKLVDAIGREWQASTIQFDFTLPRRFNITYIGPDSKEHTVYMIHRALLGSMERFFGVLIEHYAGAFPIWLAPVQVVLIPISEKHHEYANHIHTLLADAGIRTEMDRRNEKMGYKIREAQLQKIPFMLVMGDKEVQTGTVSVRTRSGGDVGPRKIEDLVRSVQHLDAARALNLSI
ncbi:MAG: threonine--tRNA ligase [Acidobacteria bacterium]|nr:threonine--tRNA ligase [Acidobacteriota bacterium]